jgi:hypothetical protein
MSRTVPHLYSNSIDVAGSLKTAGAAGSVVNLVGDASASLRSVIGDVSLAAGVGKSVLPLSQIDMGGRDILGLAATPPTGSSAACKDYVDATAQGMSVKDPVQSASAPGDQVVLDASTFSANVLTATGNGALTLDGEAVSTVTHLNRVLIKDLTATQHSGIYDVTATGSSSTPWSLTRSADAQTDAELHGAYCIVINGVTQKSTGWIMTTALPIVVDTTPLAWVLFSSPRQIQAGDGLVAVVNKLQVLPDGATINVAATGT